MTPAPFFSITSFIFLYRDPHREQKQETEKKGRSQKDDEGATEEECTASFVGLVELFLQEKNGRIRETNTPAEKQLQLLEESLLKYWKEDGVVVLETKVREIAVAEP